MAILNLDELLPEDKTVVLNGKDWTLPAEISIEIMLRMIKNAELLQKNPQDHKANEEAFKTLHSVFLINHPELSYDEFKKMVSISQYALLVEFLNDDGDKKKVSQPK